MFVRVQLTWILAFLFLASALLLMWDHRTNGRRLLVLSLASLTVMSIFFATQSITEPTVGNLLASESILMNSEMREVIITSNAAPDQSLAYDIKPDQLSGPTATAIYTAQNLFPSLIGPFPWQWKGFSSMVAGLDGLVMLLLLVLALAPLVVRRIKGAKVAIILWIGVLPLILANSLAMANYGIAMRVRANVALVLLPIAIYSSLQIYNYLQNSYVKRKQTRIQILSQVNQREDRSPT